MPPPTVLIVHAYIKLFVVAFDPYYPTQLPVCSLKTRAYLFQILRLFQKNFFHFLFTNALIVTKSNTVT